MNATTQEAEGRAEHRKDRLNNMYDKISEVGRCNIHAFMSIYFHYHDMINTTHGIPLFYRAGSRFFTGESQWHLTCE